MFYFLAKHWFCMGHVLPFAQDCLVVMFESLKDANYRVHGMVRWDWEWGTEKRQEVMEISFGRRRMSLLINKVAVDEACRQWSLLLVWRRLPQVKVAAC